MHNSSYGTAKHNHPVYKLGTGQRFAALKNQLANRKVGQTARGRKLAATLPGSTGKVTNPGALAAYIGRKKYSKAKFQALAVAGKKRKA